MTSSVDRDAEALRGTAILRDIGGGLVVGCIAIVFSFGFASVVFSGALSEYRQQGAGLILTGSLVFALASILFGGPNRLWWANQTAPTALMAVGVAALQRNMTGAPLETQFATACLFIAAATALTGLLMSGLGLARIAHLAKFVPFPVFGGFLAATGVFLVYRAAILPFGPGAGVGDLLDPRGLLLWAPYIALAFAIAVSDRWVSSGAVLLAVVAVFVLGFAALGGFGAVGAEPLGGAEVVPAFFRIEAAETGALLDLWPILAAVPALACLGLVLSVSAIELTVDRGADLNREMRVAGAANLVSGLFGGAVGHVSASMNGLADDIAPRRSRVFALSAALLITAAMVLGPQLMTAVPPGLLETVLAYAGFQVLSRWLLAGLREMPKGDSAIMLAILAAALLTDFTVAIVVGMLAAVLRFTVTYSRVDVVRSGATGRIRLSPTERSERDIAIIQSKGHETAIYELQGFLFFGTANALFDRIVADIDQASPSRRNLVVDFRRVDGMDVSAAFVLRRLSRFAKQHGLRTMYTGLGTENAAILERTRATGGTEVLPALGDALGLIEDDVLSRAGQAAGTEPSRFGRMIEETDRLGLSLAAPPERLQAGDIVFAQGAASDCLVYLVSGRLAARVDIKGSPASRVATFLPGSFAGEIGFVTGAPRTATVAAETDSVIRRISTRSLSALEDTRPDLAARFHAQISELLARRLERTTALYVSLDR